MQGIWLISHLVLWTLVLLLAAAALRPRQTSLAVDDRPTVQGPAVGSTFPVVTVRTLDGEKQPLESPKGARRLIVVTLDKCPVCETAYEFLREFQESHLRDSGFELVLVMQTDSGSALRNRLTAYGLRYRAVYITRGEAEQFPVKIAPYGLVVNDRNTVVGTAPLSNRKGWEMLLRVAGHTAGVPSAVPAPASYIQ